jgi:bacillithiol synthase
VEERLARRAMTPASVATLRRLREAIASVPDELRGESERTGLARAVEGAAHSLNHRVDRLERRLLAGIKRQESALMIDVATLRAALFPRGVRQERLLNAIPILTRQGLELLDEMREVARLHAMMLVERRQAVPYEV